jgi:hypothetical protein
VLTRLQLRQNAWAKIRAAKAILSTADWDNATYLCGYGIELILKARICVDQGLPGYPETEAEFTAAKPLKLKDHDFDRLLHLTKQTAHIKANHLADWGTCQQWSPSTRYQAIGTATSKSAQEMIRATEVIIREISAKPGLEAITVSSTDDAFTKLLGIEMELSVEHGDFDLFGMWHREGSFDGTYDLVVAAPWINSETRSGVQHVDKALRKGLKPEELGLLSGIFAIDRTHPLLRGVLSFITTRHMKLTLKNCKFGGLSLDRIQLLAAGLAGQRP